MTKTPDPSCVDCEGTGIDIVFGGPCVCTGKSKVKKVPVALTPEPKGPAPMPAPAPMTAVFDDVRKKRLTPAEHIARDKGDIIIGCYAAPGSAGVATLYVGDRVRTVRGGKTGIVFAAHASQASSPLDSQHYGKMKVLLDDGTITTRSSGWVEKI